MARRFPRSRVRRPMRARRPPHQYVITTNQPITADEARTIRHQWQAAQRQPVIVVSPNLTVTKLR